MKWKVLLKRTAVLAAVCIIAAITLHHYKEEELTASIASKVIRFHVLANSDSEEDQKLKLRVRDAVGAFMQKELKGITDVEKSRKAVLKNMDNIVEVAEAVIAKEGYDYGVKASLAQTDFPEKTYGEFTFPSGSYEALRVVIGEGSGQNWWCVMYPNLCFYNSMYEVVDKEAEKSLQSTLTAEEYAAIMEKGNYKVKFRWLSFLN